jgi:glyoxylase-like metal-dependent hydrolase (beta-lactamase superfamily II)
MKPTSLTFAIAIACLAGCATRPQGVAGTGVTLIRGAFAPGRQPDGNTVVLDAKGGVIVIDTGRHAAHAERIATFARPRGGVLAIVNTHWHLDHISGNIPLREAFPTAAIYSHDAALAEALGDFLARGVEANRKMLADPSTPAELADDLRGDIATVEQGARLSPTVAVTEDRTLVVGGRELDVHVARAVTAGDLWLYDARARLVIAGDLVTLPAPFLDTACPSAWRAELDRVLVLPFEHLAPGHGRLLARAEVVLYRDAFTALLDCAASPEENGVCAERWAAAIAPLLDSDGETSRAEAYAGYYLEHILRKPETRPAGCAETTSSLRPGRRATE